MERDSPDWPHEAFQIPRCDEFVFQPWVHSSFLSSASYKNFVGPKGRQLTQSYPQCRISDSAQFPLQKFEYGVYHCKSDRKVSGLAWGDGWQWTAHQGWNTKSTTLSTRNEYLICIYLTVNLCVHECWLWLSKWIRRPSLFRFRFARVVCVPIMEPNRPCTNKEAKQNQFLILDRIHCSFVVL